MALVAKTGEGSFEPVPEGLHKAVLYRIVDCGTQYDQRFNKYQRVLFFHFELPEVRIEREGEDKPGVCMGRYTMSLHEKAKLRSMLESWRGKKFSKDEVVQGVDLAALLGKPCQVQVMHHTTNDGRVYSNIANVLPWPAGVDVPDNIENETFIFDTETWANFEKLSDKMQDYISGSLEGKKRNQDDDITKTAPAERQDFDDDIPF
jgi:hypothetical protein